MEKAHDDASRYLNKIKNKYNDTLLRPLAAINDETTEITEDELKKYEEEAEEFARL